MIDREKVIEGIQECDLNGGLIGNCPYKGILSLLKEQKPVEPIAIKQEMFDEFYGAVSCCPKCDCMWVMYMENDMHYCPKCGQAVKWDV